MFHSYDVIKLLSKYIAYDCGVFIPVSNGIRIIKIDIVENKVAPVSGHGVEF